MTALLRIVDEHFGAGGTERREAVDLRLVSERITPRGIIRRRVEAEIEILRQRATAHDRTRSFLIDVAPAEATLNPLVPKSRRLPDVDMETARACVAFQRQAFIMLFDDRQIDDLDAEVTVTPDSKVVFLYLTPLKGG
jgi:hypothetical protein